MWDFENFISWMRREDFNAPFQINYTSPIINLSLQHPLPADALNRTRFDFLQINSYV